jgi:hypothetical protein
MSSAPGAQWGFGAEDSLLDVWGGGASLEEPQALDDPQATRRREIETRARTYVGSSV